MIQMILASALLALLFLPLQLSWWKMAMFRKWIPVRYVIGFIYGLLLFYIGLLDQSLTAVIAAYLPIIGIGLIVDNTLIFMFMKTFRKKQATTGAGIGVVILIGFTVFWMLQPLFLADVKFDISDGEEVTVEDLNPVNEEHIPVVPRSYAEYRSDILMGQLDNPAFYNLGNTRIQRVNESLYWITPIEYDGIFRWFRSDHAPGYIMVSAENPREDPELVLTEMNYVPSAFFHENLERHVRSQHPNVVMLDTTFEIDGEGNPFYIVSYGHFTEFRRVAEVDGVIIVDPDSGETEKFEKEAAPEWVNRIYPPHIAEERNNWFGIYKQGLINRFFGREGLTEPTGWGETDSVTGVVNQDLQLSWFTDHMRLQSEGQEASRSMVGFTLFDARTGELNYFRDASGSLNGRTAMDLAERTFRRDDYVAGTPSLYNIYGQYTWVVPLMDRNSVLRQIMLISARDENIYGYGETKREAFGAYQLELSSRTDDDVVPGEYTDMVEITATVERVYKWDREENVTIRILIEEYDRIFTINASSYPRAVFIEPGDEITISFMDTGEDVQAIEELDY
ncbi:hypothetical protein CR194_16015 [Salipaludibacillus keqinensis]|uniref:Uncharacterized protein n=1 Tax=Salipaludibacillus keqinensis TaxID=2045207 RepID=A0A323T9X6_9BACI|nr:hypothetical protein [Salipaludibacillus keqinensis]PYZ92338.1 hypothetical protein CR194_16015 [Salipaludibacillus keqinensis]